MLEILEPFDLTGALRGAAELAGCDRNRIAHWVRARGGRRRLPAPVLSGPRVDAFAEMIDAMEQWDYGDGPKVAGRSTVLSCA